MPGLRLARSSPGQDTGDSERIHRLLAHLERSGFGAAPKFLGVDSRGREILTFIEGFAPPRNGFRLTEEAVAADARLVRRVHDLTAGTEFAAGAEVACHRNLSQPNFIFPGHDPDRDHRLGQYVPGHQGLELC